MSGNPFLDALQHNSDSEYLTEQDVIRLVHEHAYGELEKTASANGQDLSEFDEDDIMNVLLDYIEQSGGYEELARSLGVEFEDEGHSDEGEKLASLVADIGNQVGAIALQTIANTISGGANVRGFDVEKLASLSDDEFSYEFEDLAEDRAATLLLLAKDRLESYAQLSEDEQEKVAAYNEIDNLLWDRAVEILEENNYDTETILELLED